MTVKVWSLMYMVRDILDLHGVGGQGVRASEEFPGAGTPTSNGWKREVDRSE